MTSAPSIVANPFWKLAAHGGLIPHTFCLAQWRDAWRHGGQKIQNAISVFEKEQSAVSYGNLTRALNKMMVLHNALTHLPLFLGDEPEDVYKKEEEICAGVLDRWSVRVQSAATRFFESGGADLDGAERERTYWSDFSPHRSKSLRLQNKFLKDEPKRYLQLERLGGMSAIPQIRNKIRKKAKDLGLDGYVIDPRDFNAEHVLCVQTDEGLRETIWKAIHSAAPQPKQVHDILQVRRDAANDLGEPHYLAALDRKNFDLTLSEMNALVKREIKQLAPDCERLRQTLLTKHNVEPHKPWNAARAIDQHGAEVLPLAGQEFPLKRVLHHIIPDLLKIGGWKSMGAPQKIGSGAAPLFLYRLHNGHKFAHFYFAPHPHRGTKDSDMYQAYATFLRERWTGSQHGTTPIVFVCQNMSVSKGFLTQWEDLTFLSHEIGHVLHFLALPGQKLDEYSSIPHNIGEVPSLLLEHITQDPECLAKWSDPKGPPGAKKASYWARRKGDSPIDVFNYMFDLERSWVDGAVHQRRRSNVALDRMHKKMRQETGLHSLHHLDKSAWMMFDPTECAGLMSTYLIGRAVARQALGGKPDHKRVRKAFGVLAKNILPDCLDKKTAKKAWKKSYGVSLKQMVGQGLKETSEDYRKKTRRTVRSLTR